MQKYKIGQIIFVRAGGWGDVVETTIAMIIYSPGPLYQYCVYGHEAAFNEGDVYPTLELAQVDQQ